MSRLLRHTLISARDLLATAGPFVALALALILAAYWLLDPTPPKRLILATGPDQSAYAEFGKRYRDELARYGIEVVLQPTEGASDNLRRLRDPAQAVDVAFVQGGSSDALYAVDEDTAGPALESLGSLFLEPIWIFYREQAARQRQPDGSFRPFVHVKELEGLKLNFGTDGSGVPNLMAKLLKANQVDSSSWQAGRLDQTPAVVALLDGSLDAIVVVSAPNSPMVQMLLLTPGVHLLEFAQSQAYARRFAFLSGAELPRGIADLARDVPPHDVPLVATTTSLVARAETHPALTQLLVQAAQAVHGGAGWLAPAGRFPQAQPTEWPLAKEAVRYYRDGAPFLQRYLPFWMANLVDRMWVVIVSLIAVLLPLSRIVPPVYEFRVRSRVFRWYGQLRQIEQAIQENADAGEAARRHWIEELDGLEAKVERIAVPLSYADQLYALRTHIGLVRERVPVKPPG